MGFESHKLIMGTLKNSLSDLLGEIYDGERSDHSPYINGHNDGIHKAISIITKSYKIFFLALENNGHWYTLCQNPTGNNIIGDKTPIINNIYYKWSKSRPPIFFNKKDIGTIEIYMVEHTNKWIKDGNFHIFDIFNHPFDMDDHIIKIDEYKLRDIMLTRALRLNK